MTEEIKQENVEVVDNPEVETETEVMSKEEVNRLIAQAKSKAKDEAKKEFDASVEERIKEAVEEAQKKASMSTKELEEYRKQEAEREKQNLLDKIAQLEKDQTIRELRDEAYRTLSERKLPNNPDVLNLVVKDTAEATLSTIDTLATIINEIKNEFASTTAPITSGGVGTNCTETDIFKILDDAGK